MATLGRKTTDLRARWGLGFQRDELAIYEFGRTRPIDDAIHFLSQRQLVDIVRPLLNSSEQRHILEDKWVASHYAEGIGLASPVTLALWNSRSGVSFAGPVLTDAAALEELLRNCGDADLVLKPRGGRQGRAVMLAQVESTSPNYCFRVGNDTLSIDQLIEMLSGETFADYGGGYHGWLIQKRIVQHPALAAINPDAINSVRVVTLLNREGNVQIVGALMRLGRKGSAVDNWAHGGISVGINLGSGELSRGVFKPKFGGAWTSAHPDTGVKFEGLIVPNWEACLTLARRAALAYSGIGTVGWDIAVTPAGALLMEGNADWDLPMLQVHTDGLLKSSLGVELGQRGVELSASLPSSYRAAGQILRRKISGGLRSVAGVLGRKHTSCL